MYYGFQVRHKLIMDPFQYCCTSQELFEETDEYLIGNLTVNNSFNTGSKTIKSWKEEINTLKIVLGKHQNEDGFVAFEYMLPREGGRINRILTLGVNGKISTKKIYVDIINAYRVILTRDRRGMVIYVPEGNDGDHTRNKKYYNGTYEYLKSKGIKEI